MSVNESYVNVEKIGYSTVDEISGPGPDKKGLLIQLRDKTRWDGFYGKWFLIPEKHQETMREIAMAALIQDRRIAVGVEYTGDYNNIKKLEYPEIKSMFLT